MVSSGLYIVVLAGFCLSSVLAQINWCQVQENLCPKPQQHIACEPNSFPTDPTCLNVRVLPMNATLKNLILNGHNAYRQQIASGSNSKFPRAKKMSAMQWDDTLQFVAEKHVAHCSFQHDQCRATPQYPRSGQNLYYMATALQYPNASRSIESGLAAWFDEWTLASTAMVDRVGSGSSSAYHFSLMLNDRNNKVGCGLLQYNFVSGGWTFDSFMLTCNYEYTNVLSEPMYTRGTPCSECSCSSTYPALCSTGNAGATTTTTTTKAPNNCNVG